MKVVSNHPVPEVLSRKLTHKTMAFLGLAWVGLFFIGPLLLLAIESLNMSGSGGVFESYVRSLNEPYRGAFVRSFIYAGATMIVALVLSYIIAYYLVYITERPALMMALVLMPLWVAYIIRYFGIMTFFAPVGPLSLITDDVPRVLYSSTGVVIGLANVFIPFAVLPIYNSMNTIDSEYIHASRMLGAGYFRTIANVVIPLSLPGIVAAGLIVFILSAGSYLAPVLLGGPEQTMIANQIAIAQLEAGNSQLAASLSTIYTVLLLVGLLLFNSILDLQEVFARI
ncbi:ABC transporter permease [Natronorubrum sp. FCH18a]|uniref:ABC transporter permease n=1 Tax=Natronorubrum sp. FCH18a TaxID=3447018 RepID=UPI003F5128F6